MKNLEELLSVPKVGNRDFEAIAKTLAEELMQNYRIKKEVDGKVQNYFMTDVEFYYYGPGHEDVYAYSHFYTKPGQFRAHYSGVDITLGSDWGGLSFNPPKSRYGLGVSLHR